MLDKLTEKIIELVKSNKIKTVTVDDKLYDFRNINNAPIKQIYMSKKYLKLFDDYEEIICLHKYFIFESKDNLVITNNKKILDFNISQHAKKQFVKRFIFACENEFIKSTMKQSILDLYEYHKERFMILYHSQKFEDILIDDMICELLKDTIILTEERIFRNKAKIAFAKRDKYDNTTNRYIVNPFMFIISKGVLVTVEFFSSTVDFISSNAVTSSESRYLEWFEKL